VCLPPCKRRADADTGHDADKQTDGVSGHFGQASIKV
jgi:hypothetical protein